MVQLDKLNGHRGHMIIHEDGSILSSSGELASSETTSHLILSLLSHSFPVNFSHQGGSGEPSSAGNGNNEVSSGQGHPKANGDSKGQVWKWNRLTVDFGDYSYVACLSNKRIHVVKRDNNHPSNQKGDQSNGDNGGMSLEQ